MKPAPTRKPVPVAILVRVSTDQQTTARQVSELRAHAAASGWEVVAVLEETVSGRAGAEERHGLAEALALAQAGRVRKILVHEISRLARRPSLAHAFVEELEAAGCSLYWHAHSIETLLPTGKRNPAAGIMLALLAEMARAEVETLRERIRSGLAEAKRQGVRLGRPAGRQPPAAFLAKHKDIARWLREGHSVRHTAKITVKGVSTVQRVKAALAGVAS